MARKYVNVPPGVKVLHMVPPTQVAVRVTEDPLAPVRTALGDGVALLLAEHGYETMDDLHIAFALGDEGELLKIKGIGPKTVEALRRLTDQAADDDED